ncbi:MAG: S9 family peptidase, partial [Clostridia bacterium]|nr:S9 family peptidase [Deltaproteobacteria bacterium]
MSFSFALSFVVAIAAPTAKKQPFAAADLVRLERVSDPHISPSGHLVAYSVRETDWEANKGKSSIWVVDLKEKAPRKLTAADSDTPRWSADGNTLFFLSSRSGSSQVWSISLLGGEAVQVTSLPVDVSAFAVAPGGRALSVALDVFPDCPKVVCTKERLDARAAAKKTGQLYDQLFVRHWDTWKNGTRSHIFAVNLASPASEPVKLTRDIDGDAPTKPHGDASEWSFSPDGKTLFFVARIAGRTEAWSTNTDVFSVPMDASAKPINLTTANLATDTGPAVSPDGKTLAYLAMRRPGFEADKLTVYTMPVAGGPPHELVGGWDRSASVVAWSPNGKTIYALADDVGQRRVFALDASSGAQTPITDKGSVAAFDVTAEGVVVAMDDLRTPTQLYRVPARVTRDQLTRHGLETIERLALGDYEQFSFIGWNGDMVYGYVVKPAGFVAGQKYPVAFLIHGGPQG